MPGRVIVKFRDGMSTERAAFRAVERVADRRAGDAEALREFRLDLASIRTRIPKP